MANDADSWYAAIARLIEDESLRRRIQRQARQYVQEHYAQEKFEQLFLEQLQGVLDMPAERPAERRCARSGNGPIGRGRLFSRLDRSGAAVAGHDSAAGAATGLDRDTLVRQRPLFCRLAPLAALAVRKNCSWLVLQSELFFACPF